MSDLPNPERARWESRYAGDDYFYGTAPNDFLRDHAGALPERGRVLCLGEGEGRNAVFLAERGHEVTALDQSATGLHKAAQLAAARGVAISTVCTDLEDYRLVPSSWDAIVSIWCHLPAALRTGVHRRVVAALRPGGAFLLESYTPDQLRHGTGGPKLLDLLPTLASLQEDLRGLVFERAGEFERVVHEGAGHNGLSSVVQVIARKPA